LAEACHHDAVAGDAGGYLSIYQALNVPVHNTAQHSVQQLRIRTFVHEAIQVLVLLCQGV
jgi:hypothetical protein